MKNDNEFDPLVDITEEVEALDEEIKFECFKRAMHKLGYDEGDEVPVESEELFEAFSEELKTAAIEQIFGNLYKEGLLEASGVDDKGEITYSLTDAGQSYCEEHFGEE